jgi:histone deacetylase complex subunit SAP30
MPPKSKTNHDDAKSETASVRERNNHANSGGNHGNGKLRRVASSTGSTKEVAPNHAHNQHEPTSTLSVALLNAARGGQSDNSKVWRQLFVCLTRSCLNHRVLTEMVQQLKFSDFDRDFLHDYRREFRLDTPTAFANTYHHWVLSRPGVGLHSPTMARKQDYRRQSQEELTKVVRRHFSDQGIQESDAMVNFLHKVRYPGITRPRRNKNLPHSSAMP